MGISDQETGERTLPSQAEKDWTSHVLDNVEVTVRLTRSVRNKLQDPKDKGSVKLASVRPFIVMAANYTGTYSALGTGQEYGKRIRTILLLNEEGQARTDLGVEELWVAKRQEVEKFTQEFNGLIGDVFEVGNLVLPVVGKVVEGKDIREESLEDAKESFYAYCVTVVNLLGLFPSNNDGYRLAQEISQESEDLDISLPNDEGEELDDRHSREMKAKFEKLKISLDAARNIINQRIGKQD